MTDLFANDLTSQRNRFVIMPDKLVQVKRVFYEDRVKDMNGIKEWLNCDTVLRKNGLMYFCQSIEDAEIVSDELLTEEVKENSDTTL